MNYENIVWRKDICATNKQEKEFGVASAMSEYASKNNIYNSSIISICVKNVPNQIKTEFMWRFKCPHEANRYWYHGDYIEEKELYDIISEYSCTLEISVRYVEDFPVKITRFNGEKIEGYTL